nr:aldo/keto reductase [Flavobacterium sp. RSP49]
MEKVICYCHKFLFYSNRFDPETLLEETMMALDYAVRSGKALYVEIYYYTAAQTKETTEILKQLGIPSLIHQLKYSMFVRQQ